MKALSWINMVLGLWLIAAALLFPTRYEYVRVDESVPGILIAVLAFASAVGPANEVLSLCVSAAGLWSVIINAGALTVPRTNAMIVGGTVFILGAASAIYRHRARTSP